MTVLIPLMLAFSIIFPLYIVQQRAQRDVRVLVVDENDYFINRLEDTKYLHFSYQSGDIDVLKQLCVSGDYDAVLHILDGSQTNRSNLYYFEEPSYSLRSDLEERLDKVLFDKNLQDSLNVSPSDFQQMKQISKSSISMLQIDENGNEKADFANMNRAIGIICGFLIYMFIFMYASQVLRSVSEEKTNRIVELLVSSVRPRQLMLGKIVGISLVGLTQFLVWVVLTFVCLGTVQFCAPDLLTAGETSTVIADTQTLVAENAASDLQSDNLWNEISNFYSVSFTSLIFCFLFYFIFGYLLYSALFAAVGSAVDNDTDSQQFTLPITLPLLLTIICIMPVADAPNAPLAWWLSMIPLTSPVAMLVRLPMGVPVAELALSMALLVLFFAFSLWGAAKVYRIGILMYGKKVTYRDLWQWLKIR